MRKLLEGIDLDAHMTKGDRGGGPDRGTHASSVRAHVQVTKRTQSREGVSMADLPADILQRPTMQRQLKVHKVTARLRILHPGPD
jgi:hypothetical protein